MATSASRNLAQINLIETSRNYILRFFIIKTREARTSTSVAIETTVSREMPSVDTTLAVRGVGQILGWDGDGGREGIGE